jgi:hypothetical protein
VILVWRRPLANRRTGYGIDRATYTGIPGLVAGVASFTSSGPAGIVVTSTDATGGSPAYTYQWKRSTNGTSFSNLTNGGGVSGATTLTLTDGSAVAGTLYYYQLVQTDAAAIAVTTNTVTAQLYTGGSIGAGLLYARGFTGGLPS